MLDYNQIFTSHINRIITEKNITKYEFAELTGISTAFVTALTRGEGNPSLKIMAAIAEGLRIPLPLLLKPVESDEWRAIITISSMNNHKTATPQGYSIIENAILPTHKAHEVEQWSKETKRKLRKSVK